MESAVEKLTPSGPPSPGLGGWLAASDPPDTTGCGVHPYLAELAAAERRRDFLRAAERSRVTHQQPRSSKRRKLRAVARLVPRPRYLSFGFLARLGATRGGSPGIFG
jgi:hypothetical protein